jgi:drug/metabolite transporter (DMT)-like permease
MLSKLSVARTAPFTNLITVVSVLAGVLFRGEPFSWYVGIGVAFIIFGVWGTNFFEKTRSFNLEAKGLE